MGGLAFRAPVLATLFLIVALANLAMPGSSNFVGEFLILLGVFDGEDRHRDRRVHRRRAGQRLHAAAVHPRDAQPRRAAHRVARDERRRRPRARAARAVILVLALYPQLALQRGSGRSAVERRAQREAAAPSIAATPRRGLGREAGGADDHLAAPRPRTSTGRRCRRSSRCSAARSSCCWPACCARASVREQVVPALAVVALRRRDRAGDLAVGRATPTWSPARCALDGLDAPR